MYFPYYTIYSAQVQYTNICTLPCEQPNFSSYSCIHSTKPYFSLCRQLCYNKMVWQYKTNHPTPIRVFHTRSILFISCSQARTPIYNCLYIHVYTPLLCLLYLRMSMLRQKHKHCTLRHVICLILYNWELSLGLALLL